MPSFRVRHSVIQHCENSFSLLYMRKSILFTAFHHLFSSISIAIFTICRSHFHVTRCENMALCKGGDSLCKGAKIFKENLHTSVKILQICICKDLADLHGSSRFSATIFAEPCRKNPADLRRFAKIENLGIQYMKRNSLTADFFSRNLPCSNVKPKIKSFSMNFN